MSRTLRPRDLEDIPYPTEYSSLDELSTEELVLVHYTSWRSINVTEVYSTNDPMIVSKAGSILSKRGVSFQPSFPQYHLP